MDQPSEPFSEAVAPEKQQHRQTQNRWQSVRQKQHARGDEKDSAEQSKPADLGDTKKLRGQMAIGGPGIFPIPFPIQKPIDSHGETSGKDHAQQDP
jgi:hypothetical protein